MKRLTLLLAGALLLPASANAQDLLVRRTCLSRYNCNITITSPANTGIAKVVTVPADPDAPAVDDSVFIRKCRPQIVVDNLGVSRYVYAHSGCDLGLIPDGESD